MFPQEAGQVLTIDVNDLTLHDNSASGYPRCPSLPDPFSSGSTGHEELARALSMHPRTLQRRLHSEGTTFARLLDEVRRSQFEALIAMPGGPGLTQIAHILGYAEASVLTRSCQRWFGVAPSRLKKPLLPGGSAGGQGEREAQEVQEVQEVQQEQGAGTTASHGG